MHPGYIDKRSAPVVTSSRTTARSDHSTGLGHVGYDVMSDRSLDHWSAHSIGYMQPFRRRQKS